MSIMQRPRRHISVGRTYVDIIFGILCLCIPFFFMDRSTYGGHLELESGMASSTGGSMFLVGACACLVVSFTG
jgi:hypothetical protein